MIKNLLVVYDLYLGLNSVNPSLGDDGADCFSDELSYWLEEDESKVTKFNGIWLAERPLICWRL